jgi:hypothetical protein
VVNFFVFCGSGEIQAVRLLGRFAFIAGGTARTGQGARRKTRSVTLPMSMCASPVRPWVDITIRSAPSATAASTMTL